MQKSEKSNKVILKKAKWRNFGSTLNSSGEMLSTQFPLSSYNEEKKT